MKKIFVTSWAGYSGKTAFCLGLAQVFKENGYKVGYFRPIGRPIFTPDVGLIDQDVYLMKEVLKLPFEFDQLVPILLEPNYINIYLRKDPEKVKAIILENYKKISSRFEILIIEGGLSPETMTTFKLNNLNIAQLLDSKILMVSGGLQDNTIDQIVFYKQIAEKQNKFLGAVMNRVPNHLLEKANKDYIDILIKSGVKIWGVIPENFEITSPTVREVIELLSGKILVKGITSRPVQKILIGAMETEAALGFLRRTENNAVITGGDRPNIISGAIETNASVIILTGNLQPSDQVLAKAEEKKITVIMVPLDSYSTVKALETLTGKIQPSDSNRVKLTKQMIEKYVDWKGLLNSL
jgi:BioD-like phosphotransacetylase family protein